MKSLSGIGVIILLVIAQCAYSSLNMKRESSQEQQKKVLDSINDFREKFALIDQIGNMNELSYDMELEKQAEKYNSCELMKILKLKEPTHYFPVNQQMILDFLSYSVVNGVDKFSWYGATDYFGGVLYPLHTKVGCVRLTEHCTKKPMYGVEKFTNHKEITLGGVCFFGPKKDYKFGHTIRGKPGSHCSGGQTDNGLCKTTLY